jgi:hypothetical protein
VQQRGADTTNAFNFYSAIIAALNAIRWRERASGAGELP